MATLSALTYFLDRILNVHDFPDASNNGLQVQGPQQITKIAFAVDACQESFAKAHDAGAQLLITHHGISWGNSLSYITAINHDRVKSLLDKKLGLYTAHLPLDAHLDYGNNVQLFKMLGLQQTSSFGFESGRPIGFIGQTNQLVSEITATIASKLSREPTVWKYGPDLAKKVAILTGSGGEFIQEAVARGVDTFVTGEVGHWHKHLAKEGNLNVVAAGHYATETLGVKALMPVVQAKFNCETLFVETDTGL